MKKRTRRFLILIAVLLAAAPQAVHADTEEQAVVGYCSSIISSLTLPDYTESTVRESELGRLVADALRSQTGSDLAVIGGGELSGGLRKGDLTEKDVRRVLPGNEPVILLTMTSAELWDMMEYGVSFSVLGEDETIDVQRSEFMGFPQLSGLEVEYDASALPGERVRYIKKDNLELRKEDRETVLTVAVSEYLLDWELGYTMLTGLTAHEAGRGTADLLLAHIGGLDQVTGPTKDRVKVVGTADNTILNELGILPLLPVVLIVVLLVSLPMNRNRLRNLDGSRSKRYRDYGNGNYEL